MAAASSAATADPYILLSFASASQSQLWNAAAVAAGGGGFCTTLSCAVATFGGTDGVAACRSFLQPVRVSAAPYTDTLDESTGGPAAQKKTAASGSTPSGTAFIIASQCIPITPAAVFFGAESS